MPREWRVALSRDEVRMADKLFSQKAIAEAEVVGFVRGLVMGHGYGIDTLLRVDTDTDELVLAKPDLIDDEPDDMTLERILQRLEPVGMENAARSPQDASEGL
jgi:hypothetical protein